MIIGGLQKFSLLDYPNHISAIIFTKGCNFRCHFCYNPMLVLPAKGRKKKDHFLILEDGLFDFLKKRKGKLEAVVITGGEPTLHKDLPEFLGKIKKLSYKIKLDTNGTNPAMLSALINSPLLKGGRGVKAVGKVDEHNPPRPPLQGGSVGLINYIAMDIKGSPEKYENIVGAKVSLSKIRKSIKLIIDSGLPYEFRTTVVPGLIEKKDIAKMGKLIKGAKIWYLQQFKSDTDLVDKKFKKVRPYKDEELEEMRKIGEKYAGECRVR